MPSQAQLKEFQSVDEPASNMQILIVDDSETDRMRILRLCESAGLSFTATEVASLKEMNAALQATNFDLVFIDFILTGETGLDAIDLLNKHPEQRAASIMVAGEGQIGIAVEAMRRGCSDYITKSDLTVPSLQKSVATAIERRMMTMSLQEERAMRLSLELSVRKYANNCSIEMRSILAATLRRVRKLRSQKLSDDSALELGALEASIDRLWDALPAFSEATEDALAKTQPARPQVALVKPKATLP